MAYCFDPFVIRAADGKRIPVSIDQAAQEQLESTRSLPKWQTDRTSEYLSDPSIDKYAVTVSDGTVVALGAYQIQGNHAYVLIVYMESSRLSNPTMHPRIELVYYGIGELLIAFGIRYSLDQTGGGVVVFEAKTDALAHH